MCVWARTEHEREGFGTISFDASWHNHHASVAMFAWCVAYLARALSCFCVPCVCASCTFPPLHTVPSQLCLSENTLFFPPRFRKFRKHSSKYTNTSVGVGTVVAAPFFMAVSTCLYDPAVCYFRVWAAEDKQDSDWSDDDSMDSAKEVVDVDKVCRNKIWCSLVFRACCCRLFGLFLPDIACLLLLLHCCGCHAWSQ